MKEYWTCSKFADWVRGEKKPYALSWQGWAQWKKEQKTRNKVRYWLADEALGYLQNFLTWPINKFHDLKYYINNRFITRTHCLTAHASDIRPGSWSDVGSRFLPCLFNELVDFVEIEQAWHHCMWSDDAKTQFKTPWWAKGWFRVRTWRCPEAGLEYLKWASSLSLKEDMGVYPGSENYGKPTHQAIAALEILELYKWWKEVRPVRPDPHDVSGWSEICARRRSYEDDGDLLGENETPHEKLESRKALNIANHIEEDYEKEDEDMMIRLIKIRGSLWT